MTQYFRCALLLSCLSLSTSAMPAAQMSMTFEDRIWKDFQDEMEQMHARFDAIEKHMFEVMPVGVKESKELIAGKQTAVIAPKSLEVFLDGNFVIVRVHLGDLDIQKVSIEAEKDGLEGTVPLKDGSAHFYVQNGRLFGLAMNREITSSEKNDQDKKEFHSIQTSATTKVESLPVPVADLEKTDVSYKDGILTLKLPKADKGGKKLVVKSS